MPKYRLDSSQTASRKREAFCLKSVDLLPVVFDDIVFSIPFTLRWHNRNKDEAHIFAYYSNICFERRS